MQFYGWNKMAPRRFEVFEVTKSSPDVRSVIGKTVATFETQRECEKDCLARNIAVAKSRTA